MEFHLNMKVLFTFASYLRVFLEKYLHELSSKLYFFFIHRLGLRHTLVKTNYWAYQGWVRKHQTQEVTEQKTQVKAKT